MGLFSNYPNGFGGGVTVRGVPILQTHPGQVFWVSNATTVLPGQKGGSNGNKGTFDAPFATIAAAVSAATANRGDIIMVKPGHAETVSAASGITLSKAGVAIVGLGYGTMRPTITLDTANTATIAVTAANVSLQNILIVGNFLSIATVFALTTAKHFTLDNVEFRDNSSSLGFLSLVTTNSTTNAADGLSITNCQWNGLSTSATSAVLMAGTNTRITISNNRFVMAVNNNKAAIMAQSTGKVVTDLIMDSNTVYRLNTDTSSGGILITTDATTNSGLVMNNRIRHADVAAAILVTAGCLYGMVNNLATGDADTSGFVLPAIGVD